MCNPVPFPGGPGRSSESRSRPLPLAGFQVTFVDRSWVIPWAKLLITNGLCWGPVSLRPFMAFLQHLLAAFRRLSTR